MVQESCSAAQDAHQLLEAHGPSHMVKSHGLQPSMTLKFDIRLKNFIFSMQGTNVCKLIETFV